MNRATRLALAVGLTATAISVAGQSSAAAPPPTEPGVPEGGVPIPADFVTLTDDTGMLTVAVPASWTEVHTGLDVDFGIPSIKAAPDAGAFLSSFDAPGMTLKALPFTPDTDALARQWGWDGFCEHAVVEPYDDGVMIGTDLVYTGCLNADPQAEAHVVAANAPRQPFTALLHAQIPGPQQRPILDGILATFNLTSDVAVPGPNVAADPPTRPPRRSPSRRPPQPRRSVQRSRRPPATSRRTGLRSSISRGRSPSTSRAPGPISLSPNSTHRTR
jgi:hypothetical protein